MKRTKYSAFLITGPPGSGKGTQGKILGSIPSLFHCACGDVFRNLDTRTKLGKEFVKYSSKGLLVPDKLTVKLWHAQIKNRVDAYQFKPDIDFIILDGIPRNIEQAKIISQFLEIYAVFHLTCPDREELKRRMRKRSIKENRMDDASEDVLEQRINTYDAETKPLLKYYEKEKVHRINAQKSPIRVINDITNIILNLPSWKQIAHKIY